MDNSQFASELVDKYSRIGNDLASTVFGDGHEITGEAKVLMLKMHMWNELYLGVLPVNREIELLQERGALRDNLDLFVRLADQIRDEVKHSKLFSRRIEELGGNPNILEFEATEEQWETLEIMTDHDHIVGPAAAIQVSSESILARIMTTIIENDVVDRRTREVFRQSEIDEGNHINNGKVILTRFADDPETKRYAEDVGDSFVEIIHDIYRVPYEPVDRITEPAAAE